MYIMYIIYSGQGFSMLILAILWGLTMGSAEEPAQLHGPTERVAFGWDLASIHFVLDVCRDGCVP